MKLYPKIFLLAFLILVLPAAAILMHVAGRVEGEGQRLLDNRLYRRYLAINSIFESLQDELTILAIGVINSGAHEWLHRFFDEVQLDRPISELDEPEQVALQHYDILTRFVIEPGEVAAELKVPLPEGTEVNRWAKLRTDVLTHDFARSLYATEQETFAVFGFDEGKPVLAVSQFTDVYMRTVRKGLIDEAVLLAVQQSGNYALLPHADIAGHAYSLISFPIYDGDEVAGVFLLGHDRSEVGGVVASMQRMVQWVSLASLLLAAVLTLVLSAFLARPIRQMERYARRVTGGQYGDALEMRRQDEFGRLAGHMNTMVEKLRAHLVREEDSSRRLKQEVELRTRELKAANKQLEQIIKEQKRVEDELREANLVVENSPAIVFRWKVAEDWPVIMVSRNISQFGYSQDDLLSGTVSYADMVHPDDLEHMNSEIANYTAHNIDSYQQEYRLLTRDGAVRWVDDRTTVIRGADGHVVEYQGIVIDITERKREEEAQEERERRASMQRTALAKVAISPAVSEGDMPEAFRLVARCLAETIEVPRASIWLLNEDGSTLRCLELYQALDQSYASGMELRAKELPRYFQAITHDNRIYAEDAQHDARTSELADSYLKPLGVTSMLDAGIMIGGRLAGVVCCEHIGPARKWHPDEESFVSTIASLVAQLLAISGRQKAEESCRESEAKLSALFASMTEMVVLHDLVFDESGEAVDYRITDCNAAFTRITGIRREDAIGKLATEVYRSSEPPYLAEYSRVATTGEPYQYETYYAPMDKHFAISVVSPGKNRFATITNDVTESRRIEAIIAAKNKELEQLLYVASHDLRSPLVNVDGFSRELEFSLKELSDLLDNDQEETQLKHLVKNELPNMEESIGRIRTSANQMDKLLKGLLKLSRHGRAALQIEDLDMNKCLAQLTSSFAFAVEELGVDLTLEPLPACRGDAVQVTQVFSNLIDNAIKYRDPERPLKIRVSGALEAGRAVYRVKDNGVGIAPNHIEHVFELFHRLEPGQTEGEGLGLTIARQSLSRMYGEIQVESEPGRGSIFIVRMPSAHRED